MFDQDKSGCLDFEEFLDVLKYLNLPLSKNKALRIFSEVEKGDGTIGQDEFESALGLLEERVAGRVLTLMGFSTSDLLLWFMLLCIILILIFAFIFLGIGACELFL